jgi:hypothetical protein
VTFLYYDLHFVCTNNADLHILGANLLKKNQITKFLPDKLLSLDKNDGLMQKTAPKEGRSAQILIKIQGWTIRCEFGAVA